MFSYVFMKILESRPRSYDRRIDRADRGRVREMKRAAIHEIRPGSFVLEIGCGTGELAVMLARNGAIVEGFDLSPSMIETARERIKAENLQDRVKIYQMGVDGMDSLAAITYGAVVSTLVFSELTDSERRFTLKHAFRILNPGGVLVVADEVWPRTKSGKIIHALNRLPLLILTYLISRATTTPLADLAGEATSAGFIVEKEVRICGDALAVLVARRPDDVSL